MQQFEWGEKYSVDIPQIDAQHRQIIDLLDELWRCAHGPEEEKLAPAALARVIRYAQSHLQREELMLRIRGYPDYAEHKTEHDAYRRKVAYLKAHSDRKDLVIRIANFLRDWWKYHILTSDQKYARFFRSNPENR
ncbi:putative Hemerythrin-like metal-binding protein [Candidatus Sulfopaludibacter sp. SbA3]|nr:putative Hemerythrin-like metal-binding protein [Candidatus Sulfopaludibacter sp. SbA3]